MSVGLNRWSQSIEGLENCKYIVLYEVVWSSNFRRPLTRARARARMISFHFVPVFCYSSGWVL